MSAWREVPWSVMTRGMEKEGEQLNTDELHLREFWIWWDRYMNPPAPLGGAR
jgi:p-cumate 2,3-dioxygenase alpha subunit